MKLSEARDGTGKRVKYQVPGGEPEYGVLTGFSSAYLVFVRYDGEVSSKSTAPEDLEFV